MNDRPTDLSSRPPFTPPRTSPFSVRKFALMASVVAGLGAGVYGFGASNAPADFFGSPAHAQVNNEVSKIQKPVGFADIVERVKPSVISVKVNINEKLAKDDSGNDDASPFSPALRWSASSADLAAPTACRQDCGERRADAAP